MVGLMFVLPPAHLPLAACAAAAVGAVGFAPTWRRRLAAAGPLALALALFTFVAPLRLEVSEHKPLSGLGARKVTVGYSSCRIFLFPRLPPGLADGS